MDPHNQGIHTLSEGAATVCFSSIPIKVPTTQPTSSPWLDAYGFPRSIHNCSMASQFSQAHLFLLVHGPMASFLSLYPDLATVYLMSEHFLPTDLCIYSAMCLKGSSRCLVSRWQTFTHTPISTYELFLSKFFSKVDPPSRSHHCYFFLILVPWPLKTYRTHVFIYLIPMPPVKASLGLLLNSA